MSFFRSSDSNKQQIIEAQQSHYGDGLGTRYLIDTEHQKKDECPRRSGDDMSEGEWRGGEITEYVCVLV